MNREDAEQRAQELLDYYGSGAYKGYEGITMPDGGPGVRVTGFVPSVTSLFKGVETMPEESTPDRDTHFAGAALLLRQKLMETKAVGIHDWEPGGFPEFEQVIARFAYDLALHTMCAYDDISRDFALEMIDHVPDLAEWPEQSK